jgi:hypothetical protein
MAILDHLMSEFLPDINVLRALSSTNDVAPHSMHAVVSSYTGVGEAWAKPMLSRRLQRSRYRTSVAAVDAEQYSASAVDSAVVFCIFECQRIGPGDLLYRQRFPDVERREELLPQSESAKPYSPSSTPGGEREAWETLEVLHQVMKCRPML